MTKVGFTPRSVEFDPQLANDIERYGAAAPAPFWVNAHSGVRRSPFNGYTRMLTPEGGVLIQYSDLNLGVPLRLWRVAICSAVTAAASWQVSSVDALFSGPGLLGLTAIGLTNWLVLCFKIKARHSVEIRPDCMIIDGQDVFFAEEFGENHPELLEVPDTADQMNICAVVGTRFVELMTANRLDVNDHTPEILIADLTVAIEQLWDRREVMSPAAY